MLLVSYQKSNSGRNGDEESARRRSVIRMADKIFQIPFKLSVPLASKHSSQGFSQHFAGGSGSFTSEHRKNVNVKTFWLLLFERLLFQQLSKAETKTINPKLRISEESQLKWVAGFVLRRKPLPLVVVWWPRLPHKSRSWIKPERYLVIPSARFQRAINFIQSAARAWSDSSYKKDQSLKSPTMTMKTFPDDNWITASQSRVLFNWHRVEVRLSQGFITKPCKRRNFFESRSSFIMSIRWKKR